MEQVRIGCSGWNYDDWKGRLYPDGEPRRRWLELYAVAGWVQQTPPQFEFAVKASRYLTHIKRLRELGDGIRRFYERIEPLSQAGRLGPVLWQLPENFHRDDQRLAAWLQALPDGRHTIEFRHQSWFVPEVMSALRAGRVALTIADHPKRPFQSHEATADWRFVRFHYGSRGRDGNYSPAEIDTWARRIAAWRRTYEVYAYFNNDWHGYAPANALALRARLS